MRGETRSQRNRRCRIVFSAASVIVLFGGWSGMGLERAIAADGTWNGSVSGAWSDPANWDAGTVPGAISATSTDTATFFMDDSFAGNRTLTLDEGRTIKNITITKTSGDTANTNTFTFGGTTAGSTPALNLSNGGKIQVNFNGSNPSANVIQTFNSNIVLTGSSYTFENTAPAELPVVGLNFRGIVSGGNAGGETTLTLTGTNRNAGSNSTATTISGILADGTSTKLNIVKTGTGWWMFNQTAANQVTYSGTTTIMEGTLRFNGAGAMSPNSDLIIKGSGTFRPSTTGTGPTLRSLTIISTPTLTAPISASNANVTTTFSSSVGPAITLDYSADSIATTRNLSLSTVLGGTVAYEGGLKFVPGANVATVSFQQVLNIGAVARIMEIGHGGQSLPDMSTGNTVDFQFSNILGTGTFVKTGEGLVRFNGLANTLSGGLEIRAGQVTTRNDANIFIDATKPVLTIAGGRLEVGSVTQTFGAVMVTKGSITGNFSTTNLTRGTILAPSFTFNVNGSDTATISTVLADAPSTSASLNHTGSGTVNLLQSLSYTGNTTLSGTGVLNIGLPLRPVTSSLVVSGAGTANLNAPAAAEGHVVAAEVASLSAVTGGKIVVAATDRSVNQSKLVIASTVGGSGLLDLTNNDALIHGMTESAVRSLVGSWWAGGARNGSGIGSSLSGTGAGVDAIATLAVVSNNNGSGGVRFATFDGVPAVTTDVLVRYTYLGDTDLSGSLDATDMANLVSGLRLGKTGWVNGDTNYDGVVNGNDLANLLTAMRLQGASFGSPLSASLVSGGGAVPEPAGLGLIAGLVPVLLRRRR